MVKPHFVLFTKQCAVMKYHKILYDDSIYKCPQLWAFSLIKADYGLVVVCLMPYWFIEALLYRVVLGDNLAHS